MQYKITSIQITKEQQRLAKKYKINVSQIARLALDFIFLQKEKMHDINEPRRKQ